MKIYVSLFLLKRQSMQPDICRLVQPNFTKLLRPSIEINEIQEHRKRAYRRLGDFLPQSFHLNCKVESRTSNKLSRTSLQQRMTIEKIDLNNQFFSSNYMDRLKRKLSCITAVHYESPPAARSLEHTIEHGFIEETTIQPNYFSIGFKHSLLSLLGNDS